MNIIKRNALRLQTPAESILQVSRIESGSFNLNIQSRVDIHFLISQVIEDIEKKYAYTDKVNRVSILFLPTYEKKTVNTKQEMENNIRISPLYIDCDSQKISQVIFNLLDNAMKFTAEGKVIVSTTINTDSIDKNLSNTKENRINNNIFDTNDGDGKDYEKENRNSIIVTVEDTGIGINPHIKDQLFEKFATKSRIGTGLGLYLSRKIIEAHNGMIWFEEPADANNLVDTNNSDKRRGTLFKFKLPIIIYRKDNPQGKHNKEGF